MKKLLLILFALFCIGISQSSFSQISFKGNAPRAVAVGEQFRISYVITTEGERGKDIRLPEMNGLKILYGPTASGQSSSTTIINGNVSTQQLSLTFAYILVAEKEGDWTIPAATIKVGGSEYKSNELKIKALPPDKAADIASANQQQSTVQRQNGLSNDDIFVRVHISKASVYKNEGFLVTFKLYSLVDAIGVDNIKFPEFEGFIAQEIELPENNKQMSLENYQGRNYRTVVLKQTVLYPQHSGKISIGQGKYDVIVRIRSNRSQRSRSFFDDFFDTYSDVKKTLTSSSTVIDVKPLPSGYPASFSGAVGNYKITSSISSTKLKANEPVTVKVTLSGNGNIKMLKNPEIVFPNDFEIYDPKVDVNTRVSANGVSGIKTIEYYAVPRYAGDFTIPSIQFVYFDLKTGTYKTLFTDEYHLHVEKGTESNTVVSAVAHSTSKEDIRFVGKDIRHIKINGFKYQKSNFFFGTFGYWLCYIIPALLFVIVFFVYRKQVTENANITLMRNRKANKIASRKLKLAQKYLQENEKEAFYDEILKTVWGYLSDKLTIPVSNLTKDNIESELMHYGVDENLIKKFISVLNAAEFARYAPVQNYGTMDELYEQTVEVINQMEKYN